MTNYTVAQYTIVFSTDSNASQIKLMFCYRDLPKPASIHGCDVY